MRRTSDILIVRFRFTGVMRLDQEELEKDSMWRRFVNRHGDDSDGIEKAVTDYVTYCLNRENYPTDTPGTCGPADVLGVEVESVKRSE